MINNLYLTAQEAANFLRVSIPTLERWRTLGAGPPFVRCGRRILYRVQDLEDWLASQRVSPSEKPARLTRPRNSSRGEGE